MRKKPKNASAWKNSSPVISQIASGTQVPSEPRIGPARPTRASTPASLRQLLERDRRAEERDEERRARIEPLAPRLPHVAHLVDEQQAGRSPTANFHPQISVYAPIETSIDAEVVNSLSFGSSSRTALSFAPNLRISSAAAPSAAPALFHHGRRWTGSGA